MLTFPDRSGNGMGAAFVSQADQLNVITGVGPGVNPTTNEFEPAGVLGTFNASLSGTFNATLTLQRSRDSGTTWQDVTSMGETILYTGPCEEVYVEPQAGMLYRWCCSVYTSGTINARISQ